MANGRITKRAVDALQCPQGKDRAFLWDESLAGFGVAVFPSGRKAYVAQYRKDGRSRRVTIGDHGRLTPDEARSQAKTILGAVETGADPIAERRAARAVRTFKEVAAEYLAKHVAKKRKGRTFREYDSLLKLHILPAIGSKMVSEIRRSDVSKMHLAMDETRGQANRALSLISAIWNWAEKNEEWRIRDNPAKGVDRYPEKSCERFLTIIELGRLGAALSEAETIGIPWDIDETKPTAKHIPKNNRRRIIDPFAIAAIRLLILTGARLNEIMKAQWSWIDSDRGILFLPDSKTGKKSLYLSPAALSVLDALPRIEGNLYIIAGQDRRKKGEGEEVEKGSDAPQGAPRSDINKPWVAIRHAAKLEGVRIHDLRHSFASVGAAASLGLPIIGKLLGHANPSTTARYAHLETDPMHRAVDAISGTIAAALDQSKGAKVIPLRRSK